MPLKELPNIISFSGYAVKISIVIISLFPLMALLSLLLEIDVWRHDAMRYYLEPAAAWKMAHEGRWISYILFEDLRKINAHLSIILCLLCACVFIGSAAYSITGNRLLAFVTTMIALQSPPLYMQLLWPVATLPGFVILASSPLVSKYINRWWFFAIYGVLFFGTMSYFYFLLPLLFANEYIQKYPKKFSLQIKCLATELIVPWALGFIVGYFFATFIVFLYTGSWGIQLEAWRQPNLVTGIDDLLVNLINISTYIRRDTLFMYEVLGWEIILLLFSVFLYSLVSRQRNSLYLFIPLAIFFSIYVTTLPAGIIIQTRSVVSVWIGVIFLFLVAPKVTSREIMVYSALILIIIFKVYKTNYDNLTWYSVVTKSYQSELSKVVEHPPRMYKGVIMISGDDEFSRVVEIINQNFILSPKYEIVKLGASSRWRPAALEMGFNEVIICSRGRDKELCGNAMKYKRVLKSANSKGMFKVVLSESNWLIVQVNPEFLHINN
jgi:hypothetical protein